MATLRMLLFGHVQCSAFFKKTKLASRISCMYAVNRSIIVLLSYCGALGVDYFRRISLNVRIFSKWLIYILEAFFKGFLTRY